MSTSCLPDLSRPVLAICALPGVNLVVAPVQASKGSKGHDSSLKYRAQADGENAEEGGQQQRGAAAAGRRGGSDEARDDGVRRHGCNAKNVR